MQIEMGTFNCSISYLQDYAQTILQQKPVKCHMYVY